MRISTSPPNDWDGDPEEAGYYCDLRELEDWRDHFLLSSTPPEVRGEALAAGVAGYVVLIPHGDVEAGLLVCVEDDAEGLVYVGIDWRGRARREPAANESCWHIANAAGNLPEGHRLTAGS